LGVASSASGLKGLLRRIGASSPEVSGVVGKADVEGQKRRVRQHRRHKPRAGPETRRYLVYACHPVRGVDLVYSCWLLVGQRFSLGVGDGRKRLNILGASRPDDPDCVDPRLTREDITGEQLVKLREALRARHPDTAKFMLSLDDARSYGKRCVKGWLAADREIRPVPVPADSPDLNPIERQWKSLRRKALSRWHVRLEGLRAAVAEVRDRLGDHRDEWSARMTERVAIVEGEPAVA
jgi:transposase